GVHVVLPTALYGSHTVGAVGASGHFAKTTVRVVPKATLSSPSRSCGNTDSLSGSGFAANDAVSLHCGSAGGTLLASGSADATGVLAATSFGGPCHPGGSYKIYAVGGSGATASASFTLALAPSLSPSSGAAGTAVSVSGK